MAAPGAFWPTNDAEDLLRLTEPDEKTLPSVRPELAAAWTSPPPPPAIDKATLAAQTLELLKVWTANDPSEADESRIEYARDIVVRVHELAAEYAARSFAAARK